MNKVDKAAELLKVSKEVVEKNQKQLGGGTCFWNPIRGGGSVIIADDGSFLFGSSSVSPQELEEEFKKGRRSQTRETIQELEERAKQGDMVALYLCGRAYTNGAYGAIIDCKKGFEFYEKGTVAKHALSIYGLGTCYEQGEYKTCKKTATNLLAEAFVQIETEAKKGCKYSQYAYANYFWLGLAGKKEDRAKAMKWYEKSAVQGFDAAINNLGICYYDGVGVEKNQAKGIELLKKAASMGSVSAMYNLGNLLKEEWELDESKQFYKMAADLGHKKARNILHHFKDDGTIFDW